MNSPKSGRTVAILNNGPRDETLKVTFSIDDSTANIDTANFKLFVIYSKLNDYILFFLHVSENLKF